MWDHGQRWSVFFQFAWYWPLLGIQTLLNNAYVFTFLSNEWRKGLQFQIQSSCLQFAWRFCLSFLSGQTCLLTWCWGWSCGEAIGLYWKSRNMTPKVTPSTCLHVISSGLLTLPAYNQESACFAQNWRVREPQMFTVRTGLQCCAQSSWPK